MKMEIVTTITTLIDIDTFETNHSTSVEGEEGVPESILRAAAVSGCKATISALEGQE